MEEKARSCKIPFPAHRSHGTGSPCNEAAKKITTGGQQPATQQEERNASSGDLEAEYEGEGDRGYDGGGYDDRLRVDGPEQVAAVAVGCRGCGGGATGDASGTGDTPPWCRLEGNGVAGEAARRRKEAERQEAAAGQRRAAMGWEKSWRTIR